MKMKFDKLNKMMFVAGMIAIIVLVLIAVNSTNDVIDGIWGTISGVCFLVIFFFLIFAGISTVLAIIEGLKKDKRAFIKKCLYNITWISIAFIVVYVMDYFDESAVHEKLVLSIIVLRILVTSLAIMGGEYMLADHSKEKLGIDYPLTGQLTILLEVILC